MHKRGVSAVVTTVLLISMVVVLLAVVWVVIQGFVTRSGEEISIGKVELNLDILKVYVDAGNLVVNIERGKGSGELKAINFILESDDKSEIIKQDASLREFDSDKFILSPNEMKSVDIKKVSVAPVLSSGIADVTDVWEPGVKGIECATRIDCNGKQCGDDGCGGTCGTCLSTQDCSATGLCLNKLRIFVTTGSYTGNLGGVSGADDKCNLAGNGKPAGGTGNWKALIGTTTRQVGVANWVLKTNRHYYQVNGETLIDTTTGVTDNDAWFTDASSIFGLANAITTSIGYITWTGLNYYGYNYAGADCSSWTSSLGGLSVGRAGISSYLTSNAITRGSYLCSSANRIYCVEQDS